MIDLQPFCGTDPNYHYLWNPFSQGNFTYATDGRIAIRVPRLPDFEEQKMPDSLSLFRKFEPKPDFRPLLLKLSPLLEEACLHCEGSGKEHECPNCDCKCDRCKGTGVVQEEKKVRVTIRGAAFATRYIRLIQGLPNPRFAASPVPDGATWFEFDGGDGLLAPILQPAAQRIAEPEEEPAP